MFNALTSIASRGIGIYIVVMFVLIPCLIGTAGLVVSAARFNWGGVLQSLIMLAFPVGFAVYWMSD